MSSNGSGDMGYLKVIGHEATQPHITGRTATGRLVNDVARITGYNRVMVKDVILVFLQLIFKHLINHNAVSLRWLGTFTFRKAKGRKVASKKHIGADGDITWDMIDLDDTCRVHFRPTAKLKQESRWFPSDELDSETEKAEQREKRFLDSLID